MITDCAMRDAAVIVAIAGVLFLLAFVVLRLGPSSSRPPIGFGRGWSCRYIGEEEVCYRDTKEPSEATGLDFHRSDGR